MKYIFICPIFFILITCTPKREGGAADDRSNAVTEQIQDRQIFVQTTISVPAQKILEMDKQLGLYKKVSLLPDDTTRWRITWQEVDASSENIARMLEETEVVIKNTAITGIPVIDMKPIEWKENGKFIHFLHGSAYTLNSARSGLTSVVLLVKRFDCHVISSDSAKASIGKWDKVQAEVVYVFLALHSKDYKIKNMGIYSASAGGGLATCTVLNLRDKGLGMSEEIVLWSPWADLTNEDDSPILLEPKEPILSYPNLSESSAKSFANGQELKDPRISPIYADFTKGFCPALIQEGTKCIFLSTSIHFYQRLDEGGQKPVIDMYEGMVHIFQQLPIPEAEYAIGKTADFFKKHLT